MKSLNRILLSSAFALGLSITSQAQTVSTGVPNFISYQGRVLDSTGAVVGGNGAPVNRTVTFRVWDHPSNDTLANLLYSEEQTVTIADGDFSVLVGQGITTSTPIGDPETAQGPPNMSIADAFNGDARYLGVTVSDGDGGTVDNEISPRQQIVSSAFAFRAKYAETLGTSAKTALTVLDSGNVGIGNTVPNAPLMVSGANATTSAPQFIVSDSDDPNERLRIGVNSTGNGSGFIQSFKEGLGAQNLLLNPNGGNVGIGTSNPNAPLDVNGYLRVSSESGQNGLIALGNRPEYTGYYDNGMFRGGIGSLAAGTYTNIGSHSGIAFNTSAATLGSQLTRMFIRGSDGRVGVGTTTLHGKMTVLAAGGEDALVISKSGLPNFTHFNSGGNGDHYIRSGSSAGTVFLQDSGGTVTVGPSLGAVAKLVVNGVGGATNIGNHATLARTGATVEQFGTFAISDLSILATGVINCAAVRAFSDARIKKVTGVSDGAADLAMLSQIEITDYTHIDVLDKGKKSQKKVIAQQVESIFPQAIAKTVGVIPEFYTMAPVSEGWVTLKTDLKKGDRVRLISTKKDEIFEVLEIKDGKFRTEFSPEDEDSIFIFGREVKDFRAVDYDAIAMLNVSATQQIKKEKDAEISALRKENESLRQRVLTLEDADKARESRLAAIEKLLQSSKETKVLTK